MKFITLHGLGGYNEMLAYSGEILVNPYKICYVKNYKASISKSAKEEILKSSSNLADYELSPSKISLSDGSEPIIVAESVTCIYDLLSEVEKNKQGERITKFE